MTATGAADRAAPDAVAPHTARRFPSLDGLRCVAFLLIFAHHALPHTLPVLGRAVANAWCGVDLFFVLSGFLVSYVLFAEEEKRLAETGEARFSLTRFWTRRALRIWPLYFLAVALGFLVLPHLAPPWTLGPAAGTPAFAAMEEHHALPAWCFLLNWSLIDHAMPASPAALLWSVSTEEQFYVLWPLVLALVPRRFRVRVIVGILVAAVVAKIPAALTAESYRGVYLNTFLRADTFMCGALLAHVLMRRGGDLPRPPRWAPWTVLAAAAALAWMPPIESRGPWEIVAGFALLDVAAAGFVWLCLTPGSLPDRVLRLRPLRWMGTISYGLYVYHTAALAAVAIVMSGADATAPLSAYRAARILVALAATIVVAAVSYRVFELPFLRLKERFSVVGTPDDQSRRSTTLRTSAGHATARSVSGRRR